MKNVIKIEFNLKQLEIVDFRLESSNPEDELLTSLKELILTGVDFNSNYKDDLHRSAITNGHKLLQLNKILEMNSFYVGKMTEVIGEYLFRLLSGKNEVLAEQLRKARSQEKEIEIKLKFNPKEDDYFNEFAKWPWELIYCPKNSTSTANGVGTTGFFIAKESLIYREYYELDLKEKEENANLQVRIVFLIDNIDDLEDTYNKFKEITNGIKNIEFEFINWDKDLNELRLLPFDDLEKIFFDKLNVKDKPIQHNNKIIHIVCDVDNDASSLYFNSGGTKTHPIPYDEIFLSLADNHIFSDKGFKLLILQTWKDEKDKNYEGFESFISRLLKKYIQIPVISMPYVQRVDNEKKINGKIKFFEILYSSLSKSESITQVVRSLRSKETIPRFSYGFPIFYFNGDDKVLVATSGTVTSSIATSGAASQGQINSNQANEIRKMSEYEMYRYLDHKHINEIFNTLVNLKKNKETIISYDTEYKVLEFLLFEKTV